MRSDRRRTFVGTLEKPDVSIVLWVVVGYSGPFSEILGPRLKEDQVELRRIWNTAAWFLNAVIAVERWLPSMLLKIDIVKKGGLQPEG